LPITLDWMAQFIFQLEEQEFQTIVNPGGVMKLEKEGISFKSTPKEQFFVSHLNGSGKVEASWELLHLKSKTGVRERGSFNTQKVNLWGWKHVISPELFHFIVLEPGATHIWSRTYEFFKI
ncbi:MAG: hypothetical protein R3356_04980, partial [Eudoraea sp.]|nr:hypothetical protein [Eudoraea sp.]